MIWLGSKLTNEDFGICVDLLGFFRVSIASVVALMVKGQLLMFL